MRFKITLVLLLALFVILPCSLLAQTKTTWRTATAAELSAALPARAPVERERIETEMRTASGIINSQGKIIAGVVLITAGYSAEGKYSHYLLVQSPIRFQNVSLSPGAYAVGWTRKDDALSVSFYDAATGAERGSAIAPHLAQGTRVESFRIWPPSEHTFVQIGRFALPYTLID
ncbi:hypothetical protein [Edaphobacter sp. 12200R-103]|jgi:hypothetical protein|uniref:hypothetical protein n=1 Tax=Edaphobacter sp. 12200R-103 TaxID=2703788 RepID=UPI001EE4C778|nr:hypothetical protein [Edaphobacter sp. 12200R-103]